MPVNCAVCHTENRDNAMFCQGCAGKLPAFAATGPSVLELMKAQGSGNDSASSGGRSPIDVRELLAPEMLRFWVRLGLLALAVMLAFVGWYGYVTRKVHVRAADVAVLSMADSAIHRHEELRER